MRIFSCPAMRPTRVAFAIACIIVLGACGGRMQGGPGDGVAGQGRPNGETTRDADAGDPFDARSRLDAPASCTTDSIMLAVQTNTPLTYNLEAFHPTTGEIDRLGVLDCTRPPLQGIDGLAVDRAGSLYISNLDGVYPVETTSSGFACSATNLWQPDNVYQPEGIAFVGDASGGERLFVSTIGFFYRAATPQTPVGLSPIGIVLPDGGPPVLVGDGGVSTGVGGLTGTSDGRLFMVEGEQLLQIDPTTGSVLRNVSFHVTPQWGAPGQQAPIAFWAGDVYLFMTALQLADGAYVQGGAIARIKPDGTTEMVGSTEGVVAGAGVSPCAPLQ